MKHPSPFIFAAILVCSLFSAVLSAAEKPNIILILVDDMGYSDLGCFGSEIDTPNIDSLAAAGIKFTHFTNCAKCETTRTTLMTGRYHTEVKKTAGRPSRFLKSSERPDIRTLWSESGISSMSR